MKLIIENIVTRKEAVLFNGENWEEVSDFCKDMDINNGNMIIKTLEGVHVASIGDYIIKGLSGEFYPCKPDVFKKSYGLIEMTESFLD